MLDLLEEPVFTILGAGRAFGITKQNYFAFAGQQLAQTIRRQHAALAIVGGHEADNRIRIKRRIDDHGRHVGALRFLNRAHQGAIVQRRQHDAIDALRSETFDHLDLLLAIVFAQRAFPDHSHLVARRRKLTRRFDGAGVNAFPKLMRSALGDNRDGRFLFRTLRHGAITTERR